MTLFVDDAHADDFVSLGTAARRFVPGGASPRTLFRWSCRGVKVGSQRLYLEVVYVGHQPRTTEAAVRDFLDRVTRAKLALAARHQGVDAPPQIAEREQDELEARLAAAGLADDRD
jgi:hypothetical protein